MHLYPLTLLTSVLAFAGAVFAAPHSARRSFSVPHEDGFPAPNAQQLLDIETIADGKLSNAPPPAKLEPSSLTAFQLVASNELFEAAYFKSMIDNITSNVPGFQLPSQAKKDELLDILQTILAQEELHALNAIGTLKHFNAFAPEPCQYVFPTTNIRDAVALAETFTAVVMGTLQDASQLFAKNGDNGPVRAVASVIGQEGEQNGFFRILLSRKPSEKPFLTTSVASYAWSALQGFIVPGSCPFPLSNIDIPIFKPLSVVSGNAGADIDARDQHLTFSADLTGVPAAANYVGGRGSGLFITYLTGQQLPISEPVQNVRWKGSQITFESFFPYTDNAMDGLSIAALTSSNNFTGPDDLPAATLAAPGLIQVYSKVTAWDNSDI